MKFSEAEMREILPHGIRYEIRETINFSNVQLNIHSCNFHLAKSQQFYTQ